MKIRREYELKINFGKKSRIFKYSQASAYETMEFMERIKEEDFNLILWIYDFLNKKCETERTIFMSENISKKDFVKYIPDFEKIFETIKDSYFFGSFGKTEQTQEEETMPFDAYLILLSEKLSIDPINLLKIYTFEQLSELGKGIVYTLNMQTEEGRKKNKKLLLEEKMKNVDHSQITSTLEKLEAWKQKNL